MPVWVLLFCFSFFWCAARTILRMWYNVVIGLPPIATQSLNARTENTIQFPLARSLHIAHRIHQKWSEWWRVNWCVPLVELGAVITISHGRYKFSLQTASTKFVSIVTGDVGLLSIVWLRHCRVESPEHEQSAIKIWKLLRCVRMEQKCAKREEWKKKNVFYWFYHSRCIAKCTTNK